MKMKRVVLFSLALVLVLGFAQSLDFTEQDLKSDESRMALYDKWRAEYKRPEPSAGEKRKRFKAFLMNLERIEATNKQNLPYKLKLNKFADLTNEEFRLTYSGTQSRHGRSMSQAPGPGNNAADKGKTDAPPAVDWRTQNVVTPVRDQGECACDWAFATLATIESANAIKTKQLLALSPQELLDCDRELNRGCDGGVLDHAFTYVKRNGGVVIEEAYPYRMHSPADACGKDKIAWFGTVKNCKVKKSVVTIDGYKDVPMENEAALMKAVAKQPVAVCVDTPLDFQLYGEGIFTGECGKKLSHGLAVVGYDEGQKFWILKNSWGEDWGEGGYIRLQKDAPYPGGMCGITMEASYPLINDGGEPPKEEF